VCFLHLQSSHWPRKVKKKGKGKGGKGKGKGGKGKGKSKGCLGDCFLWLEFPKNLYYELKTNIVPQKTLNHVEQQLRKNDSTGQSEAKGGKKAGRLIPQKHQGARN